MIKRIAATICACFFIVAAFCHDSHSHNNALREWTFKDNNTVKASFLMVKNDVVYLETENNSVLKLSLPTFSEADQKFIDAKNQLIQHLNTQNHSFTEGVFGNFDFGKIAVFLWILMLFALFIYSFVGKNGLKYAAAFALVGILTTFFSFKNKTSLLLSTDPATINAAFAPFKPNVATSWNSTYFLVHSLGIPTTHEMMKGITSWQQQFPTPQCYINSNAWSIPLNPVIATTPVPVNSSHFLKGAVAVAVNGIAIFNPYTNTGTDAFLDGQLDNWGGHCGRADDYHYHIAPTHLYSTTTNTLPIAFALDGFAVYGAFEPTGVAMTTLDANHGHYLSGVYHYHGTAAAPYMIGNMVGQVTEDANLQIIPQAQSMPIRTAGTPLSGATITACVANGSNGYNLTYTKSAQTYKVNYSWTSAGVFTFNYIDPSNVTTTATYPNPMPPTAICSVPTTLPVELVSFEAKMFKNTTQLTWQTASESQVSHFEIERSSDAKVFESIFQIKATNTNAIHNYKTTDNTPLSKISYYRLKSVDFDGKTDYSKVQSVNFDKGLFKNVKIFPNPFKDVLQIQSDGGSYFYNVSDVLGKVVASGTLKGFSIINTASIAKGFYFIALKDIETGVSETQMFLKN